MTRLTTKRNSFIRGSELYLVAIVIDVDPCICLQEKNPVLKMDCAQESILSKNMGVVRSLMDKCELYFAFQDGYFVDL